MKLELGIMAGAESKAFLKDITKVLERFEKVARILRSDDEIKKASASDDDTDESEDTAAEEDEIEEQPKKKSAGKKTAKDLGSYEDEDETSSDDAPETDDESEDEESSDEAEDEEEEKPAKKTAAGKTKKLTIDNVNDAAIERARRSTRAEVLGILKKKFKVKSVTELEPEQYGDVIKALQAKS